MKMFFYGEFNSLSTMYCKQPPAQRQHFKNSVVCFSPKISLFWSYKPYCQDQLHGLTLAHWVVLKNHLWSFDVIKLNPSLLILIYTNNSRKSFQHLVEKLTIFIWFWNKDCEPLIHDTIILFKLLVINKEAWFFINSLLNCCTSICVPSLLINPIYPMFTLSMPLLGKICLWRIWRPLQNEGDKKPFFVIVKSDSCIT